MPCLEDGGVADVGETYDTYPCNLVFLFLCSSFSVDNLDLFFLLLR